MENGRRIRGDSQCKVSGGIEMIEKKKGNC